MPAEAARLQVRVGGRDRRLVGAFATAVAITGCLVVALWLARPADRSPGAGRSGCIEAVVAGVMGGGTIHGCGPRAAALCRLYADDVPEVAAQCAALRRRSG